MALYISGQTLTTFGKAMLSFRLVHMSWALPKLLNRCVSKILNVTGIRPSKPMRNPTTICMKVSTSYENRLYKINNFDQTENPSRSLFLQFQTALRLSVQYSHSGIAKNECVSQMLTMAIDLSIMQSKAVTDLVGTLDAQAHSDMQDVLRSTVICRQVVPLRALSSSCYVHYQWYMVLA